ncbi:hypothetical protein MJO29_013720 [Puccinia striiformis f. sp. tritici]|nr:hypothetical protein MJO29_013720 [Puccinia striiformis f. sp. tritici]
MCRLYRRMERSGGHIDSEEFTTPTEVKLVKMKCLLCRRFMTGSLTTGSRPQLGSTLAPGRHTRLRVYGQETGNLPTGPRQRDPKVQSACLRSAYTSPRPIAGERSSVGLITTKKLPKRSRMSVRWADLACSILHGPMWRLMMTKRPGLATGFSSQFSMPCKGSLQVKSNKNKLLVHISMPECLKF